MGYVFALKQIFYIVIFNWEKWLRANDNIIWTFPLTTSVLQLLPLFLLKNNYLQLYKSILQYTNSVSLEE